MEALIKFLRRTPVRTFILYPLIVIALELIVYGELDIQPIFLPLMLWGYLQYRWCGKYRVRRGGGGPGLDTPPERMVVSGPYLYTRNPMYLGHIIYLIGLTLTLHSWFAAAITLATAIWFHTRVLGDEKRLVERWGDPYRRYMIVVKRWIPGLF
jgi:protein-S-isoprenylcysteine O-methyltransferase Ste14